MASSAPTPGTLRWRFGPEETGTWSGAAIGPDGTLFVSLHEASGAGSVYALDGETGEIKWKFPSSSFVSTPAIGEGGTIYVGGGTNGVFALEETTGKVQWNFQSGAAFNASPAIGADGTIYLGSGDHKLHALDGTTGNERWAFEGGGDIRGAAAIGTNGTVYFGSVDGKFYAVDGTKGTQRWQYATGGPILCSPALGDDGTVYFGSIDRHVYALDGATGVKSWQITATGPVDWSPTISDDMVLIGSTDSVMFSLEADTGEQCWSLPFTVPISGAQPAVSADGMIYFGATNLVAAIDHITKFSPWVFITEGLHNASPMVGPDGTVYVGSDTGPFYALWGSGPGGLANSPWPCAGQNVRRTGLMPSIPAILNQPRSRSVLAGTTPIVSTVAVGLAPLSFQWYLNQKLLTGETNAALVLTNFQAALAGDYVVVVTNTLGKVTSEAATLAVSVPPSILVQPQNQNAAVGDEVRFSVTAAGTSPLSFQWQFGKDVLAGQTNALLILADVSPSQAGTYKVTITNALGSVVSAAATLAVNARPVLTLQRNLELQLSGQTGALHRVEYALELGQGQWTLLTNLILQSSPVSLRGPALTGLPRLFFRASLVP